MPVREGFPWGNGEVCPCGKHPPGGTSKVCPCGKHSPGGTSEAHHTEKVPLGEQAKVCPRGKHTPAGTKRFPWGNKQGARSGRSQEKIKKKSRNNICTHRCSFTSPRPSHINCSDSAITYASFILQQLELAQTELQVEVHRPLPPYSPLPSPPSR